jgi:acetyltransferase-like isoleucine patch superfamily enzyme
MVLLFDALWLCGAALVWTPPSLAAAGILWRAGLWLGWPGGALALPIAYLSFLFVLAGTVGLVSRALPRPRPGTCRVFVDRDFFAFLLHWGLESCVPRPLITHIQLLTSLRTPYFRLLGARLSWSTHISPGAQLWGPGLMTLGHLSYLGDFAHLTTHLSQGDKLLLAPIALGDRCNVGAHSNVGPGCTFGDDVRVAALCDIAPGCEFGDGVELGPRCQLGMGVKIGAGARLLPRTFLDSWTTVPPGELWGGDPGKRVGFVQESAGEERRRRRRRGEG